MIDTILMNFNLERIFYILKKKIFLMIIFMVVGGIAIGYYSMSTSYELYNAKVSMYVYGDQNYIYDSTVNVSNAELIKARNLVPSYMLVLKSNTVLSKVLEKVETPYTISDLESMIGSGAVEDTAVFYIQVTNPDPYIAMEIANAIAEIAPEEISRVVKSGGVEVIDYATLPTVPFAQTDVLKLTILGAIAGFALSFLYFLFRGLLDTTIHSKMEIHDTFNIPMLGDVPMMYDPSRKIEAKKILCSESPFAFKESYNTIRTNLVFTGKGEKCPVFVITSADKSEGKTMNCINLAVSFAQLDKKILIIDADLRNPSVHKRYESENTQDGLSSYLAGLTDHLNISTTNEAGLSILTAGKVPPNPAELIASNRFDKLLTALREEYDYIFIDTPPIGLVSDAVYLSKKITGYVLIIRSNVSKIDTQKRIVKKLEKVEASICGLIYNAVNPKSNEYTYKEYNDVYEPKKKK